MKTIAIISQKGGAGKTTLALHFAVGAGERNQSVAIIDLDPQASAAGWKDLRTDERPAVVSTQPARLAQVLATALNHGVELAIIDTAPHSESAALSAARAADFILIPCRHLPPVCSSKAHVNGTNSLRIKRERSERATSLKTELLAATDVDG